MSDNAKGVSMSEKRMLEMLDSEAIGWAYKKLQAFGCGHNMDGAMMLDRLMAMMIYEPSGAPEQEAGEPVTPKNGWWSFLRSVLEQGASIHQDYLAGRHATYEHYAARLDEAAREREITLPIARPPSELSGWNAAVEALKLWKIASDNSEECELDDVAHVAIPMPLFHDADEATDTALSRPSAHAKPVERPDATTPVEESITAYLCGGGLFNPELANHDAVRDLLIDCRDDLTALRQSAKKGAEESERLNLTARQALQAEINERDTKIFDLNNQIACQYEPVATVDSLCTARLKIIGHPDIGTELYLKSAGDA